MLINTVCKELKGSKRGGGVRVGRASVDYSDAHLRGIKFRWRITLMHANFGFIFATFSRVNRLRAKLWSLA